MCYVALSFAFPFPHFLSFSLSFVLHFFAVYYLSNRILILLHAHLYDNFSPTHYLYTYTPLNYTVDVHHGNGTEETIRWLSPGLETSEVVTPMGFGTLSAPRYKPWYGENDAGECDILCIHEY